MSRMPELEITEEQAAFLDSLRGALAEEVVGPYGNVRRQDALQFLIDHCDEPAQLVEDGAAGSMPDPGQGGTGTTDAKPDDDADEDAGDDADAEEADDEADDDADEDEAAGGGGPPMPTPGGDGDEMLDEMMNLLEEHDDKWSEADSGDAKYEVELPDGGTEQAPTKDDVRALLFKNYR